MSYLRVNLVDFESMQNRDDSLDRLNRTAGEMFPDIEMMLGIATGDKSCMTVSVYADKEKASKAIDQRDKHFSDLGGMELAVAFEGDLKAFYKKESGTVITLLDDKYCLWQSDKSDAAYTVLYDQLIKIGD
mgnify:CR=1 FL=1